MLSTDFFKPIKWLEDRNLTEAEIPLDLKLPQLSQVLNNEVMCRVFQSVLPSKLNETRPKICRCRIPFLRYNPGRYCLIYYYLDFESSDSIPDQPLLIASKIFCKELSAEKVSKLTSSLQVSPRFKVSYCYIPDLKMIFTFFPNDFGISQLEVIFDVEKLEDTISKTLEFPSKALDEKENFNSSVKVMSYEPERACLIRWSLKKLEESSSSDGDRDLFVRIYRNKGRDVGVGVHRATVGLWKSEAKKSRILNIAEPLGYNTEKKILIQGSVRGVPLISLIKDREFIDYIGATARALAGIHQTPFGDQEPVKPETKLKNMEERVPPLSQIIPCHFEKLSQILSHLKSKLPIFSKKIIGFIHGDFILSQILVDRGQIGIVDFDTVSVGDPNMDIATFLARLGRSINGQVRVEATEEFCRQYELSHPGILDSNRVAWWQAVSFTRKAITSVKSLHPGWIEKMDLNLEQAGTYLRKMN